MNVVLYVVHDILKKYTRYLLQTPGFGVGSLVEDIAGSLSGQAEMGISHGMDPSGIRVKGLGFRGSDHKSSSEDP